MELPGWGIAVPMVFAEEPEADTLDVLPVGEAFDDVLWPPRVLEGHQITCLDNI